MASPPPPIDPPSDTILFRPSKKRKIYRQRAAEDDAAPLASPSSTGPVSQSLDELISSTANAAGDVSELEGVAVSMAEILRLRKQKKRVGGVEFRAAEAVRDHGGLVLRRDEDGEGEGMAGEEGRNRAVRRFAPQTGIAGSGGDVDRHMMAYIDSEIAKRRLEGQIQPAPSSTLADGSDPPAKDVRLLPATRKEKETQRQPASLGKLQEIDLGDEARVRNVAQTELARRRLDGEELEEEGAKKVQKVRLGPDGKPWRGRKRRGSEDVKRDRLVEDVLRENRLEIYDELPVESATINDDQAADDRIAEEFRREFMDAVSQRQRKKAGPAPPPARGPGGKKTEEELMKGPKLGGSRSARAAMRETLLKQQAVKK